MIYQGFVLNPDSFNLPTYRVGPFTTKDLSQNFQLNNDPNGNEKEFIDHINNKFAGKNYYITNSGKEAIFLALQNYNLKKNDIVSILTTSQNFYISSCVTKEIEKFCKWNRKIVNDTKLILVNHEFGYIYPKMHKLVSLGLPIIEDCCTTFFSQDESEQVGTYGDIAVYSFPKFFPIQIGGLLVNNMRTPIKNKSAINSDTMHYIRKVIGYYFRIEDEIRKKRNDIYQYALENFEAIGFTERFFKDKYTVPSVLLLNNNSIIKDLPALKAHLWAHGIQSSIFYGEDAFFLPNHQNLEKIDINYFISVIKSMINQQ